MEKVEHACPVCKLGFLVRDEDNPGDFMCMNCGWMSVNGAQMPGDPSMMGDNDL